MLTNALSYFKTITFSMFFVANIVSSWFYCLFLLSRMLFYGDSPKFLCSQTYHFFVISPIQLRNIISMLNRCENLYCNLCIIWLHFKKTFNILIQLKSLLFYITEDLIWFSPGIAAHSSYHCLLQNVVLDASLSHDNFLTWSRLFLAILLCSIGSSTTKILLLFYLYIFMCFKIRQTCLYVKCNIFIS